MMNLTSKDYTQYQFKHNSYNKRRLVLAVIRDYVRQNPEINFMQLHRTFPDDIQGSVGVVKTLEQYTAMHYSQPRYFEKEEDMIRLKDGTKVLVSTQWDVPRIERFIEKCTLLGYEIKAA